MDNQEKQRVAAEVINNLFKVRSEMGIYLDGEYQGLSLYDIERNLEEASLARNLIKDKDLQRRLKELFECIPGINWDEENVTDALFCQFDVVSDFMKNTKKETE